MVEGGAYPKEKTCIFIIPETQEKGKGKSRKERIKDECASYVPDEQGRG